jgi:hypothetical protein
MTTWRCRSTAVRAILRIVAIAIAVVLGRAAPAYPLPQARGPIVCSAEQPVKADALRAGERLEPRVAKAPAIDRATRLPAPLFEQGSDLRPASAAAAHLPVSRARNQRLVVLQRIPRLESGDPPRA